MMIWKMILLFNGRIFRFLVSFGGFQPPFFQEMVVKAAPWKALPPFEKCWVSFWMIRIPLRPPKTNMDPENSHFWRRKTSSKPPFFGLKCVKLVNQPRRNRWPRTCRLKKRDVCWKNPPSSNKNTPGPQCRTMGMGDLRLRVGTQNQLEVG